uniref:SET domain-containing protein n=1 Tax=Octactis speculum TaxID=3111310 RepID=A0A7S2FYA2_9STRA|mmetsp:Transcript_34548/g.46681  ORF Transcript_34548/g.46681 Transcript_34548/m.46681 type:complete len:301 (-) Transcript_34548:190-1092(-)|eukprot:CAMPEP_0185746562 /NCGR_PEP_ID=MMETSP1174-20130828/5152_1 /TAXON_ID=35687 /ORGANISM="Dictyocha speculum, Strain CCMP1381" /LENGTH=300 /DNA_ID=CAMNT_0028421335 /DNA_START=188 /DNA_END=1090 /DNA_ORIENTATION=-
MASSVVLIASLVYLGHPTRVSSSFVGPRSSQSTGWCFTPAPPPVSLRRLKLRNPWCQRAVLRALSSDGKEHVNQVLASQPARRSYHAQDNDDQNSTWQSLAAVGSITAIELIGIDNLMDLAIIGVCALPALGAAAVAVDYLLVAQANHNAKGSVVVRPAGKMGRGAFASVALPSSRMLGKYEGERLNAEGFIRRYHNNLQSKSRGSGDAINEDGLDQHGDYVWRVTDNLFIDARDVTKSNWCRFINHAEDGSHACNVEAVQVPILGVYLFTRRDVNAEEQLFIDYGASYWSGIEAQRIDV